MVAFHIPDSEKPPWCGDVASNQNPFTSTKCTQPLIWHFICSTLKREFPFSWGAQPTRPPNKSTLRPPDRVTVPNLAAGAIFVTLLDFGPEDRILAMIISTIPMGRNRSISSFHSVGERGCQGGGGAKREVTFCAWVYELLGPCASIGLKGLEHQLGGALAVFNTGWVQIQSLGRIVSTSQF